MDKDEFTRLFREASTACIKLAREIVCDHLPDAMLYEVFPNSSYDKHPLHEDERVFPEDELLHDQFHSMDAEQVVNFLWRGGIVPEWIDLSVVSANEQHTVIELLCCGRFTANRELLYYAYANRGPFGVKGPALATGYDSNNPLRFALFNPRERRRKYQEARGGGAASRGD